MQEAVALSALAWSVAACFLLLLFESFSVALAKVLAVGLLATGIEVHQVSWLVVTVLR